MSRHFAHREQPLSPTSDVAQHTNSSFGCGVTGVTSRLHSEHGEAVKTRNRLISPASLETYSLDVFYVLGGEFQQPMRRDVCICSRAAL
jgi:hypothetical protein